MRSLAVRSLPARVSPARPGARVPGSGVLRTEGPVLGAVGAAEAGWTAAAWERLAAAPACPVPGAAGPAGHRARAGAAAPKRTGGARDRPETAPTPPWRRRQGRRTPW